MKLLLKLCLLICVVGIKIDCAKKVSSHDTDLASITPEMVSDRMSILKREVFANKELTSSEKKRAVKFLDATTKSKYWSFYVMNGGLNGILTQYMTEYPEKGAKTGIDFEGDTIPDIDHWYFKTPLIQAYQNIISSFKKVAQKKVDQLRKEGREIAIASLASGTLYDVLSLDFPQGKIHLYARDNDKGSLAYAKKNAEKKGLLKSVTFDQKDVLDTLPENAFDVVALNGFSFYVGEDDTLQKLFTQIKKSLKKDGILYVTFIRPMSDWNIKDIPQEDLDKIDLMMKIIPSKWTAKFRSCNDMKKLASKAGFSSVRIIKDSRAIHSALVANL